MAPALTVEVSTGELIDKIVILEIKLERIHDESKRNNIARELKTLRHARDSSIPTSDELQDLTSQLRLVNCQLWDIEDELRKYEKEQNFGEQFVKLARSVYFTNDQRADLKRSINQLLGSRLIEEKSYAEYRV